MKEKASAETFGDEAVVAIVVLRIVLERANNTVEGQGYEVEQKLKEYELALKKYELEQMQAKKNEEKRAYIETIVIKISKGSHKLKVWNSGNTTAYNIEVSIPKEYNIVIIKDKMLFEYLEPVNNFEECVIIHMQSASKFNIISIWEDGREIDYQISNYVVCRYGGKK